MSDASQLANETSTEDDQGQPHGPGGCEKGMAVRWVGPSGRLQRLENMFLAFCLSTPF